MVREQYVQALRKRAHIVMHDGVLQQLEDAFLKTQPDTTVRSERGEP
jgi:hypothetical protein